MKPEIIQFGDTPCKCIIRDCDTKSETFGQLFLVAYGEAYCLTGKYIGEPFDFFGDNPVLVINSDSLLR